MSDEPPEHPKSRPSDEDRRARLTPEQYRVCRQGATEPPFTGLYWDCKDDGVYRCVCCGSELFSSATKFESGTGWPSFFETIDPARLKLVDDLSHGMRRTEVRCAQCDAHLGHLFHDGPRPTGRRFCINSAALDLERRK